MEIRQEDERIRVGALLDDADVRLNNEDLLKKIDAGLRKAKRVNALLQDEGRNINKLWSDTSSNIVFENDHSCWNFFTAVN